MLFIFSTTVLIRYLWQLKTVVFLHWCPIHSLLLFTNDTKIIKSYIKNYVFREIMELQNMSEFFSDINLRSCLNTLPS